MQMDTGAHLAIDGWSSPLTSSFLGVIVFWRLGSTMWHAVLDFIHLTQSHTGVYLAEKTLQCLDRFGLRHHIVLVCLDNASNNNTLVRHLLLSLPNFPGAHFHGRCMAHITNLIAQAFMSVFNRPSSRKRKLATSLGARVLTQQLPPNINPTFANSADAPEPNNPEQPTLDVLDVALDIPGELVDEGKEQHNTVEVQKAVAAAIETVYNLYGLCLSDDKLRNAREVFPKAAGFANKIHASGTMLATFAEYQHACRNLLTTKKEVPTQLVVTRWGAAAACGKTHEEFRTVVDMMTSKPGLGLTDFDMPTGQWDMLIDANECLQVSLSSQLFKFEVFISFFLEVFEEATHAHSHTGVPLVHEAIPHLLTMKFRLELMRDGNVINPRTSQPPRLVIRVAACAALNVLNKYLKLLEAADIYWLAIVLCPWCKLQWLEDNNYPASRTQQVRRILEDLYNKYSTRFGPSPGPSLPTSTTEDLASMLSTQTSSTSFWLQESPSDVRRNLRTANLSPQLSPLPAYLESPPIAKSEINKLGGLLQYWENEAKVGSILGRMALDVLTAPSSSVDAERAFSGGRMAVNYRQHRTSVETFRAKMAVGSWYGTPLLSDATEVLDMLEGKGNTEPDPLDLD
ncbi:unnamed protein product [Rhizoctonia solani]|uniref:HAT C-terminal dimerisation domain-containing protein n=1 Tax=Rhizoctonia solani TaxID=456999 RepID=A0A8H3C655_9AGAM|nr:unnamed protein product [Rhizoctonia solani]